MIINITGVIFIPLVLLMVTRECFNRSETNKGGWCLAGHVSLFVCVEKSCIKYPIHRPGWCVIKCDYWGSLCVLSEVMQMWTHIHTHTHTHQQVSSPFSSVPVVVCEVWCLMGNFVHAWVHKDSLSVACMLDLSGFNIRLCAHMTSHWPKASPEVSGSIKCLVSNFIQALAPKKSTHKSAPDGLQYFPRSLVLMLKT